MTPPGSAGAGRSARPSAPWPWRPPPRGCVGSALVTRSSIRRRATAGHLVDGAVERRLVGLRRRGEAAQLADELDRRGADLLVGRRRVEVEEGADVSAHGSSLLTARRSGHDRSGRADGRRQLPVAPLRRRLRRHRVGHATPASRRRRPRSPPTSRRWPPAACEVVRWFVFTDARGGIRVDAAGWPAGLARRARSTTSTPRSRWPLAAGAAAGAGALRPHAGIPRHRAAGARVGGHGHWLGDPDGQARLLERGRRAGGRAATARAARTPRSARAVLRLGSAERARLDRRPSSAPSRQVRAAGAVRRAGGLGARCGADLAHRHAGAGHDRRRPAALRRVVGRSTARPRLPAGPRLLRPGARLRPAARRRRARSG